jgi:MFS superfamily sulfate permease-like transporter
MQPSPHNASLLQRLSWPDLIAGLSLAGLLLPEAVAYSSIANLAPQAGVIALFAGLVCYGLIGTSRYAIVSATSSSAVVLAAASASVAGPDAAFRVIIAFALVLVTGACFVLAGAARLGGVTDFIAKPVLRGFAFGLAIVIVFKQIASVAGIAPQHADLPRYALELIARHAQWNWLAAAVAAAALLLLTLLGRVRALPGGLLVLIAGIAAGKWLNLAQYGIALVGQIDLRTELPTLPDLRYADWLKVAALSVALLLILYAESYSAIRGFALKHGDQTAPNRDLVALGAANLISGLLHGMPVGAGYSATSANEAAGAQSRLAGGYAALALLAIVLTMLPAIALTPQPVLAAIVIHAVGHTLSPAVFRSYFTLQRDRMVIIAAVAAVLVLGVLDGLLAAVAFSLLMLLRRLAESKVTVLARLAGGHDFVSLAGHPEAQTEAGIIVLRPDSALFFANAERMLAQARADIRAAGDSVHTVVLSLEESPDLDSSSVEALRDFHATLATDGTRLLFARLKAPAQQVLARAAIAGLPGAYLVDLSVDDAVTLARKQNK